MKDTNVLLDVFGGDGGITAATESMLTTEDMNIAQMALLACNG